MIQQSQEPELSEEPVISENTKKLISVIPRRITKEFLTTEIFNLLVKSKKTTLTLKCSPQAMAFLSESKECKNISLGKLELELATCKVICEIDFELLEYNIEEKI
jgi:hypothetical protein